MQNNKIGKELYWRFAKFEKLLKNNIDAELTRVFGENWIDNIVRKNEIDKTKIQLSLQDIDELEFYNQNDVQFMGIINDLSVEDEYYRARGQKDKLSLGFWVKIVENWSKVEFCLTLNPNSLICSPMLFQLFPNYKSKNDLLDTLNNIHYQKILTDIHHLQTLRNDFCHFRFPPKKLEETKTLLDKYIFLMEKPQNIKPKQKEPRNPSAQFIKNIQADNVESKDTDFEANITKVAFSKVKKNSK